jgi:hypothetical protein
MSPSSTPTANPTLVYHVTCRFEFQALLPPGVPFGMRSLFKEEVSMKTMTRGTPPNHPKSTGPENIGPERTDSGSIGIGAVGSLPATTLENNEKFRH